MLEEKRKEIEIAFEEAVQAGRALNDALMKFRSIELPKDFETMDNENKNKVIQMGRDVDMKAAFILRALLVQHGNVLFI